LRTIPVTHPSRPVGYLSAGRERIQRYPVISLLVAVLVGSVLGVAGSAGDDQSQADAALANLQRDLNQSESENAGLLSQVGGLHSDLSLLEGTNSDLLGDIDQLESQILRFKARVPLPSFAGKKLSAIESIILARGWKVRVRKAPSSEPRGTVLSQSPSPGTVMKYGGVVTLTVAKPLPKPVPAPAPAPAPAACHPSYTGACLDPNASDYDCAGGSGNGPKYTGTVIVVGPDVFGLDADGDGIGCE
jgi:hypothetical protein